MLECDLIIAGMEAVMEVIGVEWVLVVTVAMEEEEEAMQHLEVTTVSPIIERATQDLQEATTTIEETGKNNKEKQR
jgi:hypothetical protein